MGLHDIDQRTVLSVINLLGDEFYTKDVSFHSLMLNAHRTLIQHRNYHAFVGKVLKRLTDLNGQLILTEIQSKTSKGSRWRVNTTHSQTNKTQFSPSLANICFDKKCTINLTNELVRKGHFDSLRYMKTSDFLSIKDYLDSEMGIGTIYFRPTDKGITMLSLDPKLSKTRIGFGDDPYIRNGTTVNTIINSMDQRNRYISDISKKQTSISPENKFEASLIKSALGNSLKLPGFPDTLRLLHSQWRIFLGVSQTAVTDILAVDIITKELVIIELKAKEDFSAETQLKSYIGYFQQFHNELIPFFSELSNVMGELYSCQELAKIDRLNKVQMGYTAWPDKSGTPDVRSVYHFTDTSKPTGLMNTYKQSLPSNKNRYNDDSFTSKMRTHQSWYRDNVLNAPCGTGPTKDSTTQLGNMLRAEDGNRGLNFLNNEIFEVAKNRVMENKGAVEPYRLFNNLLSSQPMCFNLFGIMVNRLALANVLWNCFFPSEIKEVTKVIIEYSPQPKKSYLNDGTAFDAFIEYKDFNDELCFLAFETKLTEPFSQSVYDKPEYRRWIDKDSPWLSSAYDRLSDIAYNQLWREHLLVYSILRHPESKYSKGKLILIRHPEDVKCRDAAVKYRSLLKSPSATFIELTLDFIIESWLKLDLDDDIIKWLMDFRYRYLPPN